MLRLGDLDQKIEFFEEQSTQDDSGNYVTTNVSVLKTFAKIEQLKQSRKLEDAQLKFPSTTMLQF